VALIDRPVRRYFREVNQTSTADEINTPLIPRRADHYLQLLAYHLEPVIDDISYSTTATWAMDVILIPIDQALTDWTLDNGTVGVDAPSVTKLIDSWRWAGGEGHIVTQGGYLIPQMLTQGVTYCDLAVPAAFLKARRWQGPNQTFGVMGWLDYRWVKASPGDMAALNLQWRIQGNPAT